MKILFLSADISLVGGIQRYNKNFINALRSQGATVRLVELKGAGVLAKVKFVVRAVWEQMTLKADLVICSHINFAPTGLLLKKAFRAPYIVTLFGIEAHAPQMMRRLYLLYSASRVCTVSDFTVEKILNAAPEIKNKLFYLENSIDGDIFRPKQKNKELLEKYSVQGRRVILTVSRFSAKEKYKGYDKVLEALASKKGSLPDFVYILVGDGDDRPRVIGMAESLGLKDRVIFAGAIPEEELVDHYSLADVFVMPSRFEGFGFVFIEALACGVPTIAGNIDGSAHALLEGRIGILVDPMNIKAIAAAIASVLEKTAPPEILDGAFLREEVIKAYGIRKFEQKVRQLLHGL